MSEKPEVWLRGSLTGIPTLVQPVAHALLQAREEVATLMKDFPERLMWKKPAGLASPGFHLQHLSGVMDRLFTYARGGQLTGVQLEQLANEGKATADQVQLILAFNLRVDAALLQLAQTDESTLTEKREVGRSRLPSTVMGLYVHAAEHTMRHLGQLLVTVKMLKENYK